MLAKTPSESVADLYMLNCALLTVHEIDSGYLQEWDLFAIPGGNQVFLVLNFVLVSLLLYGFRQVEHQTARAFSFSMLAAAGGVFAFAIHIAFILLGHVEFTVPVSLMVLGALFVVSLMLGRAALQQRG